MEDRRYFGEVEEIGKKRSLCRHGNNGREKEALFILRLWKSTKVMKDTKG